MEIFENKSDSVYQDAITEKFEKLESTLKTKSDESTKSLIDVIELIQIRVDALEKQSVDISYEVASVV